MTYYTVHSGDSFTDVVLNATGSLSNWDKILFANGFNTWTPKINPGDVIIIPDTVIPDNDSYAQLKSYPAASNDRDVIDAMLADVETIVKNNTIVRTYVPTKNTTDTNVYYTVRPGDTISDVILNSTGSLTNWDKVLKANGFDTWVPDIFVGQKIIIPDTVIIDSNGVRQLAVYPACENMNDRVKGLIDNIEKTVEDNWILATGFWRDSAVWIDKKVWIDQLD